VRVLRFDDWMINRGSADFFLEELKLAEEDDASALVLVLDTPGGALQATREMVKEMLATKTPIVVYVGPEGSRAASAGVFITMAAHVAAMAPATNIGAAHPVLAMPGSPSKPGDEDAEQAQKDTEAAMLEKVTNDTVAFAKNIATTRGRNAEWAERAVRDSVSITVKEAVELDVVDLEATTLDALLAAIEGRVVEVAGGERVVLRTGGSREERGMALRHRILLLLADPSIAFGLLSLGMMLLWVEAKTGTMMAGAAGATALVLAAYGLSFVPVNVLSVLLVIAGIGMLIAEIYLATFGLLAVGGVAAVVFGGLFLVKKTPEFDVVVSTSMIAGVVLAAVCFVALTGFLVIRGSRMKVHGGSEGMIGERGQVLSPIPGGAANGSVMVRGERWSARADRAIGAGERVRVLAVDGLVLHVEGDGG
jgi:membrane-bound serine protease (ClpP class)